MAEDRFSYGEGPGKPPRGRGRRRRERGRRWKQRYNAFLKHGFTEEEATWAANEGLPLSRGDMEEILELRLARVRFFMEDNNWTWNRAVEEASMHLDQKINALNRDGRYTPKHNIFYEKGI